MKDRKTPPQKKKKKEKEENENISAENRGEHLQAIQQSFLEGTAPLTEACKGLNKIQELTATRRLQCYQYKALQPVVQETEQDSAVKTADTDFFLLISTACRQ